MGANVSEAAAVLGRIGGAKGGRSRSAAKVAASKRNIRKASASLTPEQRIERARKAAEARWHGQSNTSGSSCSPCGA